MSHELLTASALAQAEALRRGTLSSTELAEAYLDRIDAHNDRITAFVNVTRRAALKAARRADAERRSAAATGDVEGLPTFHGVPTGIKDLAPTRGQRSQFGSRAYKWFVSPFDATIVRRLNAGGFVSLGKLATSEFGVLPVTEPDIHPPTRNPWDVGRTPGGSSGGSGAAVAAGMVPIAHGSDGGGSVRIPSAFCHLYGFKPSLELLGNLHGKVNALGISVMGPLARHVEDAAAMLDVMAGRPRATDGDCLSAARGQATPVRIRMCLDSPVGPVEPEIVEATRAAARLLEELGHTVEEARMTAGTLEEFLPVWQYQVSRVPALREAVLQPVTRWLRVDGRKVSLAQAEAARAALAGRVDDMIDDADVLLTPTVPLPAPEVAQFDGPEARLTFQESALLGSFTAMFNLNKGPAATLPLGLTRSGLPYGVQLGARPGRDHMLLTLSRQVEEARPWHDRWAEGFRPGTEARALAAGAA